jgi:hypothetical protein
VRSRWPTRVGRAAAIVAAAAAAVAIASLLRFDLSRLGYSPDEEFTRFAISGIHATGLPLLPSGLLYDRGLLYSYAAAMVSGGSSLLPARILSLAASASALAVIFVEVRRMAPSPAATSAVLLAAASVPFWVAATTARFYAPFLLGYLVVLALTARVPASWRGLAALAMAAAITRWTHELAFTLVAVPGVLAVLTHGVDRRGWMAKAGAIAAGLVAAQALILAVHALAPPSNGDVMVRRFFVWQVLNLLERPPLDLVATLPAAAGFGAATALALSAVRARVDPAAGGLLAIAGIAAAVGQIAVAPTLVLAALPLAPAPARRLVPVALGVLAAGAAFWIGALFAAGRPIAVAADLTVRSGTVYPLDMFAHLLRETPLLVAATLGGLLARAAGLGGPWTPPQRALHALWIGWVLWFGVIESGITVRYLLLPVTFMLCALAVDLSAVIAVSARPVRHVVATLGLLAGVVVSLESWGGDPDLTSRPTFTPEILRGYVEPDDLVAGHDELATVMTAGRIDAWLALDPFYRERFVVMRGAQPTGAYSGALAAFELAPLLARATREGRRLIVVDAIKDMAGFGSTAQLVPRQLAREDLRAEVIADVLGARLLHVVRPREDAVARLRFRP